MSMNVFFIIGNLANDPEMRTTRDGKSVTDFRVAVNRRQTDANGNRVADFFRCVAFGKTAEAINQYFKRGRKIAIVGRVQERDYEAQDGSKRYVTEVIVNEFDFADSRRDDDAPAPAQQGYRRPEEPQEMTPEDDDELPFE